MTPWRTMALRLSLALGLLLVLISSAMAKDPFRVEQVQTRLEDGVYYLNASIDHRFSDEALEALDNGVPLTIVTHIQVRRAKSWLWEDSLLDLQLRHAIRYKPLSDRYEVYRLPGDRGRAFETREAAIRALGTFTDLPLLNQDKLEPEQAYEVQIQVALDIEELPLPLRPQAYLTRAWKLSSKWSKWPLTP